MRKPILGIFYFSKYRESASLGKVSLGNLGAGTNSLSVVFGFCSLHEVSKEVISNNVIIRYFIFLNGGF